MGSAFEWDRKKAAQNLKKHVVSFEEASTAFCDPYRVTIVDTAHSTADEQRFVTLGQSSKGRTLVVVHTERADNTRIIHARKATGRHREAYEESRKK